MFKKLLALTATLAITGSLLVIPLVSPPVVRASTGYPLSCVADGNPAYTDNYLVQEWTPGAYQFTGVTGEFHYDGTMATCTGYMAANDYIALYTVNIQAGCQVCGGIGEEPHNVQLGIGELRWHDVFGTEYDQFLLFYSATDHGGEQWTEVPNFTPTVGHNYFATIHNTGAHWSLNWWDVTAHPNDVLIWSMLIPNTWGDGNLIFIGAVNNNYYSTEGELGSGAGAILVSAARANQPNTFYNYHNGVAQEVACYAVCSAFNNPAFVNTIYAGGSPDIYTNP